MTDPSRPAVPEFVRNIRTEFLPIIVRRDGDAMLDYLNGNLRNSQDAALLVASLAYLSATYQRIEAGAYDPLTPNSPDVGAWSIAEDAPEEIFTTINEIPAMRTATLLHMLTLNQRQDDVAHALVGIINGGQQQTVAVIDALSLMISRIHDRMHHTLRRPGLSDTYCGCGLPGFLE